MSDRDSPEEMRLVNSKSPVSSYTINGEDDDSEVEVDLSEIMAERQKRRENRKTPRQNAKTKKAEKLKDLYEDELNLANAYESTLSEAGFGRYQIQVFFVVGLGIMADGVEVFLMGYVLSSADRELCLNDWKKGWLSGMVFVGMMIGALLWGNISDRIGRRTTLIICLTMNAIFGLCSAFVKTFVQFLICRLGAGIGIGGSIPVTFSYYGEFVPKETRGGHVSWLQMFYVIGGLFASGMGLAILPTNVLTFITISTMTTESYYEDRFSTWRIFILVCAIPCILTVILLLGFMSESPRFLVRVTDIYKYTNKVTAGESAMNSKVVLTSCGKCCEIFDSLIGIFQQPLVVITFVLLVCWFATSYGVYGLTLWFPEYIKRLQIDEYFRNTETFDDSTFASTAFTDDITNREFNNVTFQDVKFENLHMENVNFHGSEFIKVLFQDVTSAGTYFYNCDFYSTTFNNTNFYDNRFIKATMNQTVFINTRGGCELDFSLSYNASRVYLEILIATLGGIPGVVISALLMDKMGPKIIYMSSACCSAVSVFFIWLINTEISAAVMLAIVQCFGQAQWNALDVFSITLYPTDKRTTAFGFLSSIARIGGVLGNVTFGRYIGVNKAIPILLAAVIFFLSSGISLILPNNKGVVLM
uniref:Synaptic vesicle glycoprotein 2C-like n=1 Tax=Saccoglossus kowalevskii TaxID=10224 RepID=A0ABM0GZK0_SACKO|nr:PREDICTED: synaptic vesicle glycoprotein 2C-like [Saccoglossus kowalevskii]